MKTRRVLLGMLGILMLWVGWVAVNFGISRWKERQALATIQAGGAPVSIAEMVSGQRPTSANDAAVHLDKASESSLQLFNKLRPHLFFDEVDFAWRVPWSQEKSDQIEAIYGKHPDVMPAWQTAADAKYYHWPVQSTVPTVFLEEVFDSIGDVRLYCRLAVCRAEFLAVTGRSDEAVDICVSQFRLLDLQDRGFGIVTFLTATACRSEMVRTLNSILQTQVVSSESHAEIELALASQEALPSFINGLKTERAIGIEMFQTMPIPYRWFGDELMDYLNFMEAEVAAGTTSQWKLANATPVTLPGIGATVVPGMESARRSMNRLRGEMRCLRVLNAIHWQSADIKDLAESGPLEAAALKLPPDAVIDPFNGQPIQIKVSNGLVIYCVGTDLSDDGGDIQGERDIGLFAVP